MLIGLYLGIVVGIEGIEGMNSIGVRIVPGAAGDILEDVVTSPYSSVLIFTVSSVLMICINCRVL